MKNISLAMVLLCVMCAGESLFAEDFSVKLSEVAEIDKVRAVPEFVLKKVLDAKASRAENTLDGPVRLYDVHMHMKGIGKIRLDRCCEFGPTKRTKGAVWRSGLDQSSVVAGWIKNAPDMLLVAWVNEPDGRGTALTFYHSCLIARVTKGKVSVLMRRCWAVNCRPQDYSYEHGLRTYFFTYDDKTAVMTERIWRQTELFSSGCRVLLPLHHRIKKHPDYNDEDGFRAVITETIVHKRKYAEGKLTSVSIELSYKSQKGDLVKDIARFYLGPLAPRNEILKANPTLAAKYKNTHPHPGWIIYLPPGTQVKIPVSQEWLKKRYGH